MISRLPLFLLSIGLPACVIPIPSVSTVTEGCEGRVVNAQSAAPVSNAVVKVFHTRRVFSDRHPLQLTQARTIRTDASGRFKLAPTRQYHWGYLFGVALNYPLPYPKRLGGPDRPFKVEITHPGFQEAVWHASLRKTGFEANEPSGSFQQS